MNNLSKEKSPYLLQHAQNPVDWHAWNDAAFEKAKKEEKPILLSIGYSTCHWCHVMEHESFEDVATAKLMNDSFVSIKVDREERPDIDHIYMNYVIGVTGSGGWPMTVFLTPDKKPFYGGTYFPPEDRYGMPGFKTLLNEIAGAWKNRRDEILKSADSAADYLRHRTPSDREGLAISTTKSNPSLSDGVRLLEQGFQGFAARFDSRYGGFGRAPKFPMGHSISFLLRYWKRSESQEALEMAVFSLKSMAAGGDYDHLGGGFHRYSTDAQWRIPHFEKMLYDQALLVKAYLEAFQATHDETLANTARETLDYVLRDMTGSEGGFYSAEDADSLDTLTGKKREGAYYVWTKKEIENILGQDAPKFIEAYGIQEEGNALSDPHHEFEKQNVLFLPSGLSPKAKLGLSPGKGFGAQLERLRVERAKRPKPHKDDKVLTDWNGLMITAFAMGYRVLGDEKYLSAAQKSARFILSTLRADGQLLHRYRDGEAAISGSLSDYAFFIEGLVELYQADFDAAWLNAAIQLADTMIRDFQDTAQQGFFMTSSRQTDLLVRPKDDHDGAIPSGNSSAATVLFKLARLTGEKRYQEAADSVLQCFSVPLTASPSNLAKLLEALDFAIGPSSEIVIAPEGPKADLSLIIRAIYSKFIPNKVVVRTPAALDWLKDKTAVGGKTTLYICQNQACRLPTSDPEQIKEQLKKL